MHFSFVSPYLPQHTSSLGKKKKKKCRLVSFFKEVFEFSEAHTVGGHLPFQPGSIIYYLVKAPLSLSPRARLIFL